MHFDSCSTKLLSARKGGLQYHLWIKEIRQYLYSCSFTILTDHRPLLSLFGPQRPVPAHAAARLQRWALILALYNYKIGYRSTGAHVDADSMSRLPLPLKWSPKCGNVERYFWTPTLSLM